MKDSICLGIYSTLKGGHEPFKHLALMVALIGPPPSEFVRCRETTEQYFDPGGKQFSPDLLEALVEASVLTRE